MLGGILQKRGWVAVWVAILGPLLLFGYNNCAAKHGTFGSSSMFGIDADCDQAILTSYSRIVQPFLAQTNTCASCHVEGGAGLGTFASPDTKISYEAFKAAGLSKISYMATNPGHKPPHTGSHNQTAMNSINNLWPKAENEYLSCLTKNGGGIDVSLLTIDKPAPNIYNITNADPANPPSQTLTFDLEDGADLDERATRTAAAVLAVDVKPLFQVENGRVARTIGYTFTNPRLTLKAPGSPMVIEGLYVYINRKLISSQTTFTSISRVMQGTTTQILLQANGNTIIAPVTTTDTFSFYFQRIVATDQADGGTPPPTPVLGMSDANGTRSPNLISTGAQADLNIYRDAGVTRWCISQSPTKPANTEAACNGPGPVNGWYTSRPLRIPVSGTDGVKNFYLWVANGNLAINNTAATYQMTLDTVGPTAPSISSSGQYSGVQIAQLTINNSADSLGWCVFEQNAQLGTNPGVGNAPPLNDDCWSWGYGGVKPTNVGFNGGGSRYVWAWTRDEAGNISAMSNRLTLANSMTAVTYGQLTAATSPGSPNYEGAVFSRHCAACHQGAMAPGFQQVQLFNFDSLMTNQNVANNGDRSIIVSRTNDAMNPMPNVSSGLMDTRYRNLIRLWVSSRNELRNEGRPPR